MSIVAPGGVGFLTKETLMVDRSRRRLLGLAATAGASLVGRLAGTASAAGISGGGA